MFRIVFGENGKQKGMAYLRQVFSRFTPAQVLVFGFAALIMMGTFLLMLPAAARGGQPTPLITAFFTATSAVCVTGLVVVDTASHYSLFGQLVILGLIQVGGLGIMTMTTLFAMLVGKRINLRERLLIQEGLNAMQLEGVVSLVKSIVKMTLLIEVTGGLILSLRFIQDLGWARGFYYGFFHSISAFCNAGFDLFGTVYGPFSSLIAFKEDPVVSLTIPTLIILGGLGFVVIRDVTAHRRFSRLSLHSKLVITITLVLVVAAMAVFWFLERRNTLSGLTLPGSILASFFQAVTPRTAGYNTLNISALRGATQFFIIILMFIGASPGSTGGGIKTTTFGALVIAAWSVARGKIDAEAFKRNITQDTIFKALAVAMLAVTLIATVTMILTTTEKAAFLDILFETTSAFGTVGLTTGITPDLSKIGRILISITMYAGRVGPLTLALAIWQRRGQLNYHYPEEKIIVG